jgi:hypothetical protein
MKTRFKLEKWVWPKKTLGGFVWDELAFEVIVYTTQGAWACVVKRGNRNRSTRGG